jgi:hypothetical protein
MNNDYEDEGDCENGEDEEDNEHDHNDEEQKGKESDVEGHWGDMDEDSSFQPSSDTNMGPLCN